MSDSRATHLVDLWHAQEDTLAASGLAAALQADGQWPRAWGIRVRLASERVAASLGLNAAWSLVLCSSTAATELDACREALLDSGVPHALLMGDAGAQQAAALQSVLSAEAGLRQQGGPARAKWAWVCPDCDDADCERHWLAGARG